MNSEGERLQNVLDSLQAGVWEWDIPNDTLIANTHWAQMLGYSLAELEPLTIETTHRLCHPEDLLSRSEQLLAHLAGETTQFDVEARLRHKDGHWVWVLDTGRVVQRDPAGQPLKMVGVRQDISARKQAEEIARNQGERFLALARVSNTGVWEWDQSSNYLWCSPEYLTMLGRRREDFPNTKSSLSLDTIWMQWLHPEDRQRATTSFKQYLAAGAQGMYENEFRMRHEDGSWVWIWSRGIALPGTRSQSSGRVVGTHINITSLKQAESHLRESQQRLELISNNLPDAMVFQMDCGVAGEMRALTYVSQGVERLHQLTVQEVQKDISLLYGQLLPEDVQRLQREERACLAELTQFRVEARNRLPDGSIRWLRVVSSPRRLSNGHIVFDGIETDITEHKLREQEIHALNTQLEQRVQERTAELRATLERLQHTQEGLLQSEKLAALGALVAGVAHELNTPIGNAVTVASTLQQARQRLQQQVATGLTRTALTQYLADAQECGEIIERNLHRAAQLVGSFKQLAVDQTSTQRRRFDLQALAQEIALTMRPAIRRTAHQLHTDIPPKIILDSYPGPLGQVLMNLIGNALIHAFSSDMAGQIWLQAQLAEPACVRIEVRDDGCGIPAAQKNRVFDPFFTTKLGQGGSGLGLHIAYTLVSGLLGGRIALGGDGSPGSCFTLELPLCAPMPQPDGVQDAAQAPNQGR